MIKSIDIPKMIILILFVIIFPLYYFYAPADTKKRPIIGETIRRKLRLQTLIILTFLLLLIILIPQINKLIMYGVIIETVTILPVTYRILKEDYNNYEKYENGIT